MESLSNKSVAVDESLEASVGGKEVGPRIKEIQGSFALEGIHISDARMKECAEEFERMKKSGQAQARILEVLGRRPFRQG